MDSCCGPGWPVLCSAANESGERPAAFRQRAKRRGRSLVRGDDYCLRAELGDSAFNFAVPQSLIDGVLPPSGLVVSARSRAIPAGARRRWSWEGPLKPAPRAQAPESLVPCLSWSFELWCPREPGRMPGASAHPGNRCT